MLKKVSYLILGFILMFSFYDEVFGAGQCYEKGTAEYEQLCGENPIAVYRNTAINSSGSCSGGSDGSKCGGEIKTTVSTMTEKQWKKRDSNVIFNSACNCKDEKEGYHVLVMVDSSNSMELGNKFADVRKAVKEIARKYHDSAKKSVLQICYFNGDCTGTYNLYNNGLNRLENYIETISGVEKSNTNYIKALNTAKNKLDRTGKIPIVYFLTDGYPTELSNEGSIVDQLGWLSTARYAYETLKRMDTFKNQLKKASKNVYGYENAKFYTWGINIKAQDSFAKYILKPDNVNFNNLGNGDVSSGEAQKLKSYLSGTTSGYEIVMGAASYPDRGLVTGRAELGAGSDEVCDEIPYCTCTKREGIKNNSCLGVNSRGKPRIENCVGNINQGVTKTNCRYTKWTHKVIFETNHTTQHLTKDKNIVTFPFYKNTGAVRGNDKGGIMFLVKGINEGNYSDIKLRYVEKNSNDPKDVPSQYYRWDKLTDTGYSNTMVCILSADYFYEYPQYSYRLVWKGSSDSVYARMTPDTGISGLSESQLRDVVDESYIGGIGDFKVKNPSFTAKPSPEMYDEIDITTAQHTNAINREVNVSGFKVRNSNGSFSSVTLTVPIVITQSTNFTPSNSLKSGSIR